MVIWTPTVLIVLYACVLYFCICTCSVQLSMFHMERRSKYAHYYYYILLSSNIAGCRPDDFFSSSPIVDS